MPFKPLPVNFVLALGMLCASAGHVQALMRVPNTSLNVPLEPPGSDYAVEDAFGPLDFTRPVAIVSAPDETNRLFIVEQAGIISVITNLTAPNRTVFLDIDARVSGPDNPGDEQGLLGLAFHPGYATNGFFFVFYTGDDTTTSFGRHDILSRFEVSPSNPNEAQSGSEVKLIVQRDAAYNHNGGGLHFGPDGYLYISVGDEGGSNDNGNNSQQIDKNFFSGILRIDTDKRTGSLQPNTHPAATTNYTIPPDNPFVGATNFNGLAVDPEDVRTEFWAVGLRNPWRISFDSSTGELYCGDVGQSTREEVDLIVKGGNYGWAYREGNVDGPKAGEAPNGFTSIPPLLDYSRGNGASQGFSVTGGLVYRGQNMANLFGAYIFGDYVSENIWALRHDGTNATSWEQLLTVQSPVAFGTDPHNGDVLIASLNLNRIKRLVATTNTVGTPLPETLADTQVFTNLQSLIPNPGIVPYGLNVSFWSDNAIKSRWFSVPDTNQFMEFSKDGNWLFPTGSVWVKHFELELTNGVPESRRRLETRLLVKNEQGVHGFTYRWGDSTSNAVLVAEGGLDETFVIDDGGGLLRTQVWHYPSRSECIACHTPAGGYVLGFSTAQLNRSYDMGEGTEAQIAALSSAGYFTESVSNLNLLPSMPDLTDTDISLEHRVRAYLSANCVYCHSPEGKAPALWDATFAAPTAQAGIIDGPLVNDKGNPANKVVARGSLELSMALQDISIRGPGQMPPLGTTVVDAQGVELLTAWILNDLPSYQTFAEWQVAQFGSTNAPGAGWDEDFDGDADNAYLEYLNDTNPKLASSRWRVGNLLLEPNLFLIFNRTANRGYELQFSDDFNNPQSWTPVDSPWNAPTYLSSDDIWFVPDSISTTGSGYWRVQVYAR